MALTAVRTEQPAVLAEVSRTPPSRDPSRAYRRARRSLLILLLALVVAQPLSIPLAYHAIREFIGVVPAFVGMDVHTQWEAYQARPKAPDVLFIGDSQTFTDIDTVAVSADLSNRLGRPISVAKFGVPGEGPAFLDALMYRVMHRPSRPRWVVLEINQTTMNANRRWDPTADLWELSNPPDPGFMNLALRVDPYRWRLIRAWLVPYFMTYQPVSQLAQCSVVESAQQAAVLLGHVPLELREKVACKSGAAYLQVNRYREDASYRFSDQDASYVREAVEMAHAGGTQVMFGTYPVVQLEAVNPVAHQTFQSKKAALVSSLGVPTFDLVTEMTDEQSIHDPNLWLDPAHMEPAGARALAPKVSQVVAPVLLGP
jgi:hypothetical protein